MHAQQLVIIQWMDSCIPKEEEEGWKFHPVAIILSVICFSFCGYYIVCHLFFFLWLLYCLSFVFLSVAIMLLTDNIIATERKTND
jgi:hypothetical protein